MYLQFKQGFIEADQWDGSALPGVHQAAAKAAGDAVIVVRARERSTVEWVVGQLARHPEVFKSPPTWDYEWRAYVSADEWAIVLSAIARDINYRNFKSWSGKHSTKPREHLAHAIWHAAVDALQRPS